MDRKILRKALARCKKEAGLAYALAKAPDDCMTCSNYSLAQKHGDDSKGIWVKWFSFGMNRQTWEVNCKDGVYIVHDLTEEQGKIVKAILSETYDVDWDGDASRCILIKEKAVA